MQVLPPQIEPLKAGLAQVWALAPPKAGPLPRALGAYQLHHLRDLRPLPHDARADGLQMFGFGLRAPAACFKPDAHEHAEESSHSADDCND